jgi:hypothetical protein
MNARTLASIAGVALAASALGVTQLAAGATPARTLRVQRAAERRLDRERVRRRPTVLLGRDLQDR